jgi:hypothetical protein
MAEPGDQIAAGTGGRGHLRASHADREQVIEALKAAFVQGQLDRDEFDLRVGRALASPACADLAVLTADIAPARLTRARPLQPAGKSANKKRKAVAALACATLALLGGVAALPPMPDGSPAELSVIAAIFVLAGIVFTGWFLLLHAWLDERACRRSAQELPPGGDGGPSQSLAPPDPARQLPPVARDPWPAAEAAPIRRPRPALPHWRMSNRRRLVGPLTWEPVSGIEPLTCRLQEVRPPAPSALPAGMTPVALGLSGRTFHEPFHADAG